MRMKKEEAEEKNCNLEVEVNTIGEENTSLNEENKLLVETNDIFRTDMDKLNRELKDIASEVCI